MRYRGDSYGWTLPASVLKCLPVTTNGAQPIPKDPGRGSRVVILSDHKLVAEALGSTLVREGMDLVAVVTEEEEAFAVVAETRPELVVLDLGRLSTGGIEWSRRVRREFPHTRILALIAGDRPVLARVALEAGIQGCLSKDSPMPQFITAIRAVLEGQMVMPLPVARAGGVVSRSPEQGHADLLASQLTERERDVLALLVEGASSQEMARRLRVTRNTIRTHIQNILMKLQVHSRLEAAAFAVRHGVLSLD